MFCLKNEIKKCQGKCRGLLECVRLSGTDCKEDRIALLPQATNNFFWLNPLLNTILYIVMHVMVCVYKYNLM